MKKKSVALKPKKVLMKKEQILSLSTEQQSQVAGGFPITISCSEGCSIRRCVLK